MTLLFHKLERLFRLLEFYWWDLQCIIVSRFYRHLLILCVEFCKTVIFDCAISSQLRIHSALPLLLFYHSVSAQKVASAKQLFFRDFLNFFKSSIHEWLNSRDSGRLDRRLNFFTLSRVLNSSQKSQEISRNQS